MTNEYKFRNLPCSIQPDNDLWCVSGSCDSFGSGVLEWCYDEEDACHRIALMLKDKRMHNLKAEKFIQNYEVLK